MRAVWFVVVAGAMALSAPVAAQAPAGAAASPAPGRGAAIVSPAPGWASVRLEDWGRMATAASPILGWKVGVPANGFRRLTFSEAAGKADALGVAFIEG